MVEVHCHCGTKLRLGDEWAGKQGRCPRCQAVLDIPAAAPLKATAPPAVPPQSTVRPSATKPPGSKPPAPPLKPAAPPRPSATPASQPGWMTWPRLAMAGGVTAVVLAAGVVLAILAGRDDASSGGRDVPVAQGPDDAPVPKRVEDAVKPPPPDVTPRDDAPPPPATNHIVPPVAVPETPNAPAPPEPPAAADTPRTTDVPPKTPRAKSTPPRELTGISRRFDDLECSRIQQRHGRRVPPAATILEVDGQRLPVGNLGELQSSPSPYLFLPRGEHAVRWREGERALDVSVADDLAATYAEMRSFFDVAGNIRSDELFSRGARAMDVHRAPFLLNFTGAVYAARNEWPAAERRFRRALRVNPLFSPAHLNLAHCLAKRGQRDEAVRELYLAQAFNVGDVFGLQAGVVGLGRELGVTPLQLEQPPPVQFVAAVYVAAEPLSEEDRRLTAILLAASKYAVREEDCGKILNNLAVHFAESNRPELALDHFRSALESFRLAGSERFDLARRVLAQMAATCRRAGYVEAEEYAQMQNAVMP